MIKSRRTTHTLIKKWKGKKINVGTKEHINRNRMGKKSKSQKSITPIQPRIQRQLPPTRF